jgi:hypothetical protein
MVFDWAVRAQAMQWQASAACLPQRTQAVSVRASICCLWCDSPGGRPALPGYLLLNLFVEVTSSEQLPPPGLWWQQS